MSGVVNVRTLERMRGVSLWLKPGAYGRAEGAVLAGVDHDTLAGVVWLRGVREDRWRPHTGYTLRQAHQRLGCRPSPTATLHAADALDARGWESPQCLNT